VLHENADYFREASSDAEDARSNRCFGGENTAEALTVFAVTVSLQARPDKGMNPGRLCEISNN